MTMCFVSAVVSWLDFKAILLEIEEASKLFQT